jgi:cytochrome oxidase assembly protein ShyY1
VRFLLRPGWLALIAAVLAFVVACYTFLAPWQFGREAEREAQQAAIASATATPPAPPGAGGPRRRHPRRGVAPGHGHRQLPPRGRGRGAAARRGRAPAVEVLTPFRTTDGRVLVVGRGTVATSSGAETPAIAAPPAGEVTLTAAAAPGPDRPAGPRAGGRRHRQLYSVDTRLLAGATGLPLEPGWLQLAEGQPGVLTPLPVQPDVSGAPFTNLSYALQWVAFGVVALVALGYFIRLELLQRSGRQLDRTELRKALAGDD